MDDDITPIPVLRDKRTYLLSRADAIRLRLAVGQFERSSVGFASYNLASLATEEVIKEMASFLAASKRVFRRLYPS